MTPYYHYFKIDQFTESHSSRLDGTKHSAHTTTKFQKKNHTYVCTAEEHKRRENSWVLVLIGQNKNGPMEQREDDAEAIRIKERLYEESGKGRTKTIPANKYSKERINRSEDSVVNERIELNRNLDGDGILPLPHRGGTPNPRTFNTSAHDFFSRGSSLCLCLVK